MVEVVWRGGGHPGWHLRARGGQGGKPVPKKTIKQAERVLGEKRTEKIVKPSAKLSPKQVSRLEAIFKEANRIEKAKLPYQWGGGHTGGKVPGPNKTAYDCSGAVSRVLQQAGIKIPSMTSGELARTDKLADGPGEVTIYANDGHVLMSIGGRFWGTSQQNPQGGAGWIPRPSDDYLSQFTTKHVKGLGKDVAYAAANANVGRSPASANSGIYSTSAESSGTGTPGRTTRSKQRRQQSVSRRLKKIDRRLTTPLSSVPESDEELIRRIVAGVDREQIKRLIRLS